MSIPVWLKPGSTIKRWLLAFAVGMLIIILGLDYLLVELYRTYPLPSWVGAVTLQFVPRPLRGALFVFSGVLLIVLSLRHLNRTIVGAMLPAGSGVSANGQHSVIDAVAQYKLLRRGPRVVAIGGGTGMSQLLRGLRTYTRNLTVVVTVADDGGSSGRLRRELRILPPGDFRQCIVALADVEPLMAKLLQYRFKQGSGLEGHPFGNLFIAAMADIHGGSFEKALAETSRVLAVRGQILPSTLQDVTLAAQLCDQSTIKGESVVATGNTPIERVFLIPNAPEANPEAVAAILDADVIVAGPGSLYTSIMPNLLVPGIAEAIEASPASLKLFVCNVATEPGETDGYSACDFVRAVERHVGCQLFDYVITNSNYRAAKPGVWKSEVVQPGDSTSLCDGPQMIECDLVDTHNALHHDPQKLAQLLLRLFDGKARTPDRPWGRRAPALDRAATAGRPLARGEEVVAGRA